MKIVSSMTPNEKSRELQAWERLNTTSLSSDYSLTMDAEIRERCLALHNEMLSCDDARLPAVRHAYKEMSELLDYPAKRMEQLRKPSSNRGNTSAAHAY